MLQKPMTKFKYIVGIDEAGRGPLAGPLAVGLVMMKSNAYVTYKKSKNSLPRGIDSKKLTESRREVWFETIKKMQKAGQLEYKVIFTSPAQIDRHGLSRVIKNSISTGLKKLIMHSKPKTRVSTWQVDTLVLLDGGLKAPLEYQQKTIVKGDEKENIIGLASICAKVLRDRKMRVFAKKYPAYKFDVHKGYGTLTHRSLISSLGLSVIHRKSICRGFT
jgi:ribonuclease HII